jgi:myo-inositol 2-dehydrogenase/D-chiro-inositol 1-dehydrogenase
MTPLRVGFIGCGRHATKALYPSLRYAGVELMAVCDVNEARARRNARWFGAQRFHTDHREMLDAGGLDAVIVVTGPGTHAALATDALEAGLPVFTEKPPARDVAEAEGLVETSARTGRPVTVGMMKRHAPAYTHLREVIGGQGFGPLTHVASTFRVGPKASTGYAFLLDAGIHHLDLMRHLVGDYEVSGMERLGGVDGITYALLLRFTTGVVGSLHLSDRGSWLGPVESVEITGSGRVARADNLTRVSVTADDGAATIWEPGFSIPQNANNSFFIGGYVPELSAWAEALTAGQEPPTQVAEMLPAMRLIERLEPDRDYRKTVLDFPHWRTDHDWLRDD